MIAIVVAAGYLLGSLPVGIWVARRHGVDLLRTGDGNPGAWNALQQLGRRRALPVFVGDAAKGFAAGLLGLVVAGWWGAWAAVAAAMVGHALPVFARFRGGKSVMTFVGGVFVLAPLAAAICAVACLAVTAVWKFTWGARIGVFGVPVVQLLVDGWERAVTTLWLMAIIGVLFGVAWLRDRTADPATHVEDEAPRD